MSTVNRGWLKRQIAAGKVEARCQYHLTDDYAWDNANDFGRSGWMPVEIRTGNEWKETVIQLWAEDFRNKSGGAYRTDDGMIHYYVHSNLHYEMRIAQ